jgi:hypothetical protein
VSDVVSILYMQNFWGFKTATILFVMKLLYTYQSEHHFKLVIYFQENTSSLVSLDSLDITGGWYVRQSDITSKYSIQGDISQMFSLAMNPSFISSYIDQEWDICVHVIDLRNGSCVKKGRKTLLVFITNKVFLGSWFSVFTFLTNCYYQSLVNTKGIHPRKIFHILDF